MAMSSCRSRDGPCIACLFPDMVNDDRYPCPGTPAIADILQALGALAVYAVDTLLMKRPAQLELPAIEPVGWRARWRFTGSFPRRLPHVRARL